MLQNSASHLICSVVGWQSLNHFHQNKETHCRVLSFQFGASQSQPRTGHKRVQPSLCYPFARMAALNKQTNKKEEEKEDGQTAICHCHLA